MIFFSVLKKHIVKYRLNEIAKYNRKSADPRIG